MSLAFERHRAMVEEDIHTIWQPHRGQASVCRSMFVYFLQYVFLQCGRKFGKLNRLDEPILTPSGYRLFGDLQVGDSVYDEMGRSQSVTYITPTRYNHPAYRVHFCNGSTMDVGEDHLWNTWTKADRKNSRRGLRYAPSVKSTKDIFDTQMCGKEYNHSIPYSSPIIMDEKKLLLDPYLLGCWLGDGDSNGGGYTTLDYEILDSFRDCGFNISKHTRKEFRVLGLSTVLRSIGVINNKHVPHDYLFGSVDQRLELLKGLMDSDGTINKSGNNCCFDNTNKQLAESAYHLIASLGMKPIWKERIGKLYGVEKKRCYRVFFRPTINVFKLKRHSDKIVYNNRKFLHHTIVKVEKIESSPMRCISVTGPSHLYLIGKSLIPTHNTEFAVYAMYMIAMLFPKSQVYFIADTAKHAGELIWENRRLPDFFTTFDRRNGESDIDYEVRMDRGRELKDKWITKTNDSSKRAFLTNGSFIGCEGAENYANADGINPNFIVYDEFKHHDYRFHEAMEPNLDTKQAPCLILGTPPDNFDNNYCKIRDDVAAMRPNKGKVFYLPSYLNPILYPNGSKDEKFLEKKAQYERRGDWDVFQREYLARIVIGGSKAIFPVFDAPEIDFLEQKIKGHTKHVRPAAELYEEIMEYPKDWNYYCAADPGTTVCFAVLIVAINKHDRRVRVLKEIYEKDQRKTTTKQIYPRSVEKMKEVCVDEDRFTHIYDNAAAWYENEVNKEYDVMLTPCTKDTKEKEEKLGQIKDMMLIDNMMLVSDECYFFIWEVTNYIKDKNGKIPKENDHLIDDFRYVLNEDDYDFINEEQFILLTSKRGYRIEDDEFDENELVDDPDADLKKEYFV